MGKRQIIFGIAAYLLLIVSGAFSDVVIFSLFALPVFFVSVILCIVYTLNLPIHEKTKKWRADTLLIIGILLLATAVFYTAIESTQYLVGVSRAIFLKKELTQLPWINILKSLTLALASSFFVAFGVKERTKWHGKTIFFLWLAIFLSSPLTIVGVKIVEIIGFPLST